MSQAIPTLIRTGKNSNAIYAKIKNGNVYKLNANVPAAGVKPTIAKIKQAGRINLKHWTKCEPRPAHKPARAWLSGDRPRTTGLQAFYQDFKQRATAAASKGDKQKLSRMWANKAKKAEALSTQIGINGENAELFQMVQMERDFAASLLKEAV